MAIKMVVFDMAGTTVEDRDNVHEAFIHSMDKFGYSINREDANSVMGMPKPMAIGILLRDKFKLADTAELTDKVHTEFVREMIDFYKTDPAVKSKPNAEKTFQELKDRGIKVVIDTGFSRDIADAIIERLKWKENKLIDFSVTSDEVERGRPYPDMVFHAMKEMGINSADEVTKVGDTSSDMEEGTSAGCRYVVGVTTGAYSREEMLKTRHTHLIADLLEIIPIVTE